MNKIGKKQWRRFISAGIAAALAVCLPTGCGKKEDPENLLKAMQENAENIESAKCGLTMDISVSQGSDTFAVAMDMDMDMTEKPYALHGNCDVNMNMSGMDLGTEMEIYQVEEEDEIVSYTLMENMWSKSTDSFESAGTDTDMFGNIADQAELFETTGQNISVNGRACYEMSGDIKGEALLALLGNDMMRSVSGVDLASEELAKAEIPCTVAIYKDDILPARITVDLTDVVNKLALGAEEEGEFSECGIELTYLEFNCVDEITVPDEAVESTDDGAQQESDYE